MGEIVYNGDNPRLALDEAVRVSNREISYKMAGFGYVKNGVVVKNYIVPSIYNIDLWLTEVEKMKKMNHPAWFLTPYWILFTLFIVVPTIMAILLSFTYFNTIEAPEVIG